MTYSITAFNHVDLAEQVKDKRKELLSKLFKILKENDFSRRSLSGKLWKKGKERVKVSWKEFKKGPLFSGFLPGSRGFKPNVMICVEWARSLQNDPGIKKISEWLKKVDD